MLYVCMLTLSACLCFQDRDQEFLLRVGILPALRRMASYAQQGEYFPAVRAPSSPSSSSSSPPWPPALVVDGLRTGALTIRDVVNQLQGVTPGVLPPDWLAANGLAAPGDVCVVNHTLASIGAAYTEAAEKFLGFVSSSGGVAEHAPLTHAVLSHKLSGDPLAVNESTDTPVSPESRLVDVSNPSVTAFRGCAQSLLHLLCALALGFSHSPVADAVAAEGGEKEGEADAGEDVDRRLSIRYIHASRVCWCLCRCSWCSG